MWWINYLVCVSGCLVCFFINPDSNFNRFFFLKTTFWEVILSAELGIPFSSELHAFLSAVSGGQWVADYAGVCVLQLCNDQEKELRCFVFQVYFPRDFLGDFLVERFAIVRFGALVGKCLQLWVVLLSVPCAPVQHRLFILRSQGNKDLSVASTGMPWFHGARLGFAPALHFVAVSSHIGNKFQDAAPCPFVFTKFVPSLPTPGGSWFQYVV